MKSICELTLKLNQFDFNIFRMSENQEQKPTLVLLYPPIIMQSINIHVYLQALLARRADSAASRRKVPMVVTSCAVGVATIR